MTTSTVISKFFKDISPFQGWREFNTPTGWIRTESLGNGYFAIYIQDEDAFIRNKTISTKATKSKHSCRYLYNAYLSSQDENEDSNEYEDIYA